DAAIGMPKPVPESERTTTRGATGRSTTASAGSKRTGVAPAAVAASAHTAPKSLNVFTCVLMLMIRSCRSLREIAEQREVVGWGAMRRPESGLAYPVTIEGARRGDASGDHDPAVGPDRDRLPLVHRGADAGHDAAPGTEPLIDR